VALGAAAVEIVAAILVPVRHIGFVFGAEVFDPALALRLEDETAQVQVTVTASGIISGLDASTSALRSVQDERMDATSALRKCLSSGSVWMSKSLAELSNQIRSSSFPARAAVFSVCQRNQE